MYEWSEEDLMIRDALRGFIDKEVRPHLDELETGVLPPYDIARKLYTTFGVDQMAREGLEKELESEATGEAKPGAVSGGMGDSTFMLSSGVLPPPDPLLLGALVQDVTAAVIDAARSAAG